MIPLYFFVEGTFIYFWVLNFAGFRLNETDGALVEVVDGIVVLQELGSEDPVFFFGVFCSDAFEVWGRQEEEAHGLAILLTVHHVRFFWHLHVFGPSQAFEIEWHFRELIVGLFGA